MLEGTKSRNVVPKWRSSKKTVSTNEASFGEAKKQIDYSADVLHSNNEFQLTPSIPIASELMFLANEAKDLSLSTKAAKFILNEKQSIKSNALLKFAAEIIGESNENKAALPDYSPKQFLQDSRKLLLIEYRNPILLIDMARALTALGHHQSALRYVRTAIELAPTSRFVVRSTARYFLHIGDHDQAHAILRRSPSVKTDPWIQASELAVATMRNRPSLLSKQTFRALLEAKVVGPNHSELASAVATMELKSGSNKNAKLLFKKSLASPNDNSLAQAEWAAERLKLIVDERVLKTPLSFEANSNNAYRRMNIGEAISHAKRWADDEPFASRPLDTLSYFYCLEDDFESALSSSEMAVRREDSETLSVLLNRLFSRIQLGYLDESFAELHILAKHPEAKAYAVHIAADYGALAYAAGHIDEGRTFYEKAIEIARKRNDPNQEAQALAFFARAAIAHSDPKFAEILGKASKQVLQLPSQGAIYVVSRLVSEEKRKDLLKTAAARVQKREWTWDSASNTLRLLD